MATRSRRKKKERRYSSDRPIDSRSHDLLGRAGFANRLADDIRSWRGRDSLVIALYGGWGCGKTSLKNLVLSSLRRGRSRIPTVEFNPWQFSGSGGISQAFFRELGSVVGEPQSGGGDATERAEKLTAYAKKFSFGGALTRAFGLALAGLGEDYASAANIAATAINEAAAIAEAGGQAMRTGADKGEKSLAQLKSELAETLVDLPQPVLVVIDDIDRLTTSEILEVFQLVKVNADFPNVTYLLLFERSIVAKALDGISGERGFEFLEKIVQVGYHVPVAPRAAMNKVLFTGLDECMSVPGLEKRWQNERWIGLFNEGLSPLFHNLRHVYRFLASFDFHVRHFQAGEYFEVNPIDLIGLEALRVFEPEVFERIVSAKRILTREEGLSLFSEVEQSTVDEVVNQLLEHASPTRRQAVRRIVEDLFPPIGSAYAREGGISGDEQEWLRMARVCHGQLFDRYFTLAIPTEDLAQKDVDHVIALTGDRARFVHALVAIEKRGLLHPLLTRLDAHKSETPVEAMPTLIRALCDVADNLPDKKPGLFDLDPLTLTYRFVYFGLRRENDPHQRSLILKEAFEDTEGIALPVKIVGMCERRNAQEDLGREFLIAEGDWRGLADLCVSKIRSAAIEGRLREHSKASMLLWRWIEWDSVEEVRSWVSSAISEPGGALWLVSTLLGEVHEHGAEVRTRYYLKLSSIARFADLEQVNSRINECDPASLSEREGTALREFCRAWRRREEGKPEQDWTSRDDE